MPRVRGGEREGGKGARGKVYKGWGKGRGKVGRGRGNVYQGWGEGGGGREGRKRGGVKGKVGRGGKGKVGGEATINRQQRVLNVL